jgi:hypothetical protein
MLKRGPAAKLQDEGGGDGVLDFRCDPVIPLRLTLFVAQPHLSLFYTFLLFAFRAISLIRPSRNFKVINAAFHHVPAQQADRLAVVRSAVIRMGAGSPCQRQQYSRCPNSEALQAD